MTIRGPTGQSMGGMDPGSTPPRSADRAGPSLHRHPDHGAAESVHDLADVYREHVGFAWRVVRRMGVPEEAVPDTVQEVFLVVHRRLADYDGRASLRAWIAGICRGVVRNHHRAASRRDRRLRLVDEPEASERHSGEIRRLEVGRMVAAALDELDEDQRLALVLTDIEGLTPADVAEATGVSRNTVYSRLRLARKKLRHRLAGLWPGFDAKEDHG